MEIKTLKVRLKLEPYKDMKIEVVEGGEVILKCGKIKISNDEEVE